MYLEFELSNYDLADGVEVRETFNKGTPWNTTSFCAYKDGKLLFCDSYLFIVLDELIKLGYAKKKEN